MFKLSQRFIPILLFLILIVTYSWFIHCPQWNDFSRYDLIVAAVQKNTLAIDAYQKDTGDKAFINGHYYSDKAPGMQLAGIPIYGLIYFIQRTIYPNKTLFINQNFSYWIWKFALLRIVLIIIPTALMAILFLKFLQQFTASITKPLWMVLGYCLGTLAFPYSTLFFSHQFAAVLVFSSFMGLFYYRHYDDHPRAIFHSRMNQQLILSICGFMLSYAVISEYPVILLAAILTGYAFDKNTSKKEIGYYILGAIIPLLILLSYNYIVSGNIFKLAYSEEVNRQFYIGMNKGVGGVTYPKITVLIQLLFGLYRGILLYNPVLILGLIGFIYFFQNTVYRREFWVGISCIGIYLLFNSSYYMWWGGAALGPRHLIPIIPFFILPIVFLPDTYHKWIPFFVILSILLMFIGTSVGPQIPDFISSPLLGYATEQFILGYYTTTLSCFLNLSEFWGIRFIGLWLMLSLTILIRVAYLIENKIPKQGKI